MHTVGEIYRRLQALRDRHKIHRMQSTALRQQFGPTRTRPQASWRTAWRNLRKAAGLPALRFHDLRHHAITELAESQASDSTVMAIAGHVSPKMLQHYSHVRLQAKRSALDALSTRRADLPNLGGKTEGYDTNHDTKQGEGVGEYAQVIETMVELVGIEPTTSSLRTMRSPS